MWGITVVIGRSSVTAAEESKFSIPLITCIQSPHMLSLRRQMMDHYTNMFPQLIHDPKVLGPVKTFMAWVCFLFLVEIIKPREAAPLPRTVPELRHMSSSFISSSSSLLSVAHITPSLGLSVPKDLGSLCTGTWLNAVHSWQWLYCRLQWKEDNIDMIIVCWSQDFRSLDNAMF